MKLDLDRSPLGCSELDVSVELHHEKDTADESRGETTSNVPDQSTSLQGRIRLDNLQDRMLLSGQLLATVPVTCDRCLKPFVLQYEVPVEVLVLRGAEVEDETEK